MENKTIETLRRFFTISVAAFEMQNTIAKAFGHSGSISSMHQLHLSAKEEIFKDNPNMEVVDNLICLMEYETKNNNLNK